VKRPPQSMFFPGAGPMIARCSWVRVLDGKLVSPHANTMKGLYQGTSIFADGVKMQECSRLEVLYDESPQKDSERKLDYLNRTSSSFQRWLNEAWAVDKAFAGKVELLLWVLFTPT
jgi:hypothetical protein